MRRSRRNRISDESLVTAGGAMALIGATVFAYMTKQRVDSNKVVNKLNKTVISYLDKKLKEGKIKDDEYIKVAVKVKDNLEEVIQVGCKKFVDGIIGGLRAKEIITK